MSAGTGLVTDEIKRLNGCINDLATILTLPAIWFGCEKSQVLESLLEALLGILRLDFAFARASANRDSAPIEIVRLPQRRNPGIRAQHIGRALDPYLTRELPSSSLVIPNPVGDGDINVAFFRLGLLDETGILVAGAARPEFPTKIDMLLLRVAVNQAAVSLQEAGLFEEHRRTAAELEQRVAERTLEYRTLFDSIDEGFCTIEVLFDENSRAIDYRFLDVNPAFGKHTGIRDAKGRRVREIIPHLEEHWFDFFGQIALTGEPARVQNQVAELRHWYDVYAFRVGNVEERKVAVLFNDITERKMAEEVARASEERFRSYFELGLIGVAMTSPTKGILEINDELCRILGYQRDELLKANWAELTHPDDLDADVAHFNRVLAGEMDGYIMDKRWIRKDGRLIDTVMSAKCLRRADGSVDYVVGLVLDITERKRAEHELHVAQAQLAHIARVSSMGELAASIAHEVNQPLAAIVMNGDASLRWLNQTPPNVNEARAAIKQTVSEGHRASEVISRIRALIKKGPRQVTAVSLNRLIEEVLVLTRQQASEQGIKVRIELDAELPPVSGDPIQLQQVLVNLILNAIEATSAARNGPQEVFLSSQRKGSNEVVIAIQDSGAGIDPRHMDQLFQPFFTTKATGMGMGLAIGRSIIEAHGGRLWANSNERKGATFKFSLPTQSAGAT
jgi:PAS domain S-box-containing protein